SVCCGKSPVRNRCDFRKPPQTERAGCRNRFAAADALAPGAFRGHHRRQKRGLDLTRRTSLTCRRHSLGGRLETEAHWHRLNEEEIAKCTLHSIMELIAKPARGWHGQAAPCKLPAPVARR